MTEPFKYLTYSEDDEKWGLYLNVIGHDEIQPDLKYPPKGHPKNYDFNWKEGRILDEFQIIYITKGSGIFETKTKKFEVKEGNVIFLYPFIWHRYKPDSKTGWTEYYVGFNGESARQMMEFFPSDEPVQYIGFNDEVYQAYLKLIDLVELEKIGYQQIAAGHVQFILGSIRQIVLNHSFADNKIEKIINQARLYMRSNLTRQFSMEEMAQELNISYSLFRSEFKKYTGMPPGQYLLQLRVQSAKYMLTNTDLTVKEIAYAAGFESPYYFSKTFKKHVGTPPVNFRQMGIESRSKA